MVLPRNNLNRAKRLLSHRDWPLVLLQKAGQEVGRSLRKRLNFAGSYEFIDRSRGSENLLIVVAGYKEYLWDLTLPRIARFAPKNFDVCVVSPGVQPARLLDFAKQCGWSYLKTKANKLALAQNIAIREHPQAQWIHKLDEDIFVSAGYFEGMRQGYAHIREEGSYDPGFCAPLINVNGYSYRAFLRILELEAEYRTAFGESRSACMGVRAHWDPAAARWLWKKSLPFDDVANLLASRPFEYSVVPHRFSIGAILLERNFWESIGGFRTSLVDGALGIEEEDLCFKCMALSRVMCVVHSVFAGHFAFGPQESGMTTFLSAVQKGVALSGEWAPTPIVR